MPEADPRLHGCFSLDRTACAAKLFVQLLDFDAKRLHYFMRMLHGDDGAVCAWTEIMLMHVDMATVSGTPMPAVVLKKVRALAQSHRNLARPEPLTQAIGIRR